MRPVGKGANGERGRRAGAADSGAAIDGEGHPSGGGRGAVRSAPFTRRFRLPTRGGGG